MARRGLPDRSRGGLLVNRRRRERLRFMVGAGPSDTGGKSEVAIAKARGDTILVPTRGQFGTAGSYCQKLTER